MSSKQILENCLNSQTITVFEDNVLEFNKVLRQEKRNGLSVDEIKKQYDLYLGICQHLLCVVSYLNRPFSRYNRVVFSDLLDTVSAPEDQQFAISSAVSGVCEILAEFCADLEDCKQKGLISDSENCFQLLLSRYDCRQYLGARGAQANG